MHDMYLLVVQPVLANYRRGFFDGLADNVELVEVFSDLNPGEGFKSSVEGRFKKTHTPVIGNRKNIYYQIGVFSSFLKNRPSAVFMTADFRALNFWVLLVLSKIFRVPVFSHGQGLYNKPNPSHLQRFMFKIVTSLSSQYVCYTDSVRKSLIDIGISASRLLVMDNTIVNESVVEPDSKKNTKHRLLYVGRLREGCDLQLLFEAMRLLENNGIEIGLDVVGDGPMMRQLEELVQCSNIDVRFFGAIYDDQAISDISQKSTIGIYPGDAGLSVVHYMSLSLIPIVHDDLTKHMGPEPSYIKPGINGVTFKRGDSISLAHAIEYVLNNGSNKVLSEEAYKTYCSLSQPAMANKLLMIMKPYLIGMKQ